MATATRKKVTAYQKLVKTKTRMCQGKATASDVNKAGIAYVKDAISKGKSSADANRTVSKVKNRSCKTKVAGTRKRKTTAKRTTRR